MSQGSAPALKPTAKTVLEHAFGGRIPVLRPDLMSDEQKQVYDRINASQVPWAANAGFRVKADDRGLLGPYNSQLLSPGTNLGYLDMLDAEKKHTSLSRRVREVIILSVGAVWKADYEIYAHSAVGRTAGLSESAMRTLAAGDLPDDLDGQGKDRPALREATLARTPGRSRPVCRGRAVLRAAGFGGHNLPYRDISEPIPNQLQLDCLLIIKVVAPPEADDKELTPGSGESHKRKIRRRSNA